MKEKKKKKRRYSEFVQIMSPSPPMSWSMVTICCSLNISPSIPERPFCTYCYFSIVPMMNTYCTLESDWMWSTCEPLSCKSLPPSGIQPYVPESLRLRQPPPPHNHSRWIPISHHNKAFWEDTGTHCDAYRRDKHFDTTTSRLLQPRTKPQYFFTQTFTRQLRENKSRTSFSQRLSRLTVP